jgi:predicted metal-dependent hydrolase
LLALWWFLAARMLLAQDGVTRAQVREQRARMTRVRGRRHAIWQHVFLRGILEYARPGFHPWNRDDRHLAEPHLARIARPGPA